MNIRIISIFFISVLLVACGGGSGGDGGDPLPPERPSGIISGKAFDSNIANADVSIFSFNGNKGAFISSGTTDNNGNYNVSIKTVSQYVLIEVTKGPSGNYIEESSGLNVFFKPDNFLKAVAYYESGKDMVVPVTYFTTIGTGLTEYNFTNGQTLENSIINAYSTIDNIAGFNVRLTTPVNVADNASVTAFATDSHKYGFISAAISQLTKNQSIADSSPVHSVINSISFITTAYDDIKHDGLLNGIGASGVLSNGSKVLSEEVYRRDIAVALMEFIASNNNATQLNGDSMLSFVNSYNNNINGLYSGVPVIALSGNGPTITNTNPVVGSAVRQTITPSFSVNTDLYFTSIGADFDSNALTGIVFNVSKSQVVTTTNIDTTQLSDGAHVIDISATEVGGQQATKTVAFNVDNTPPNIVYGDSGTGTAAFFRPYTFPKRDSDGKIWFTLKIDPEQTTTTLKINGVSASFLSTTPKGRKLYGVKLPVAASSACYRYTGVFTDAAGNTSSSFVPTPSSSGYFVAKKTNVFQGSTIIYTGDYVASSICPSGYTIHAP